MFGSLGMPELVIILVIALIIFGPRKLPELGRSLGKSIGEFRKASNELKSTLEDEIRARGTEGTAREDGGRAGLRDRGAVTAAPRPESDPRPTRRTTEPTVSRTQHRHTSA